MKIIVTIFFALIVSNFCYAQEDNEKVPSHHKISVVMGNSHVSSGIENGGKKWLVLSSWGIDYEYWFNGNWGIGLHSDIVLENYIVESYSSGEETEYLDRNYPISLTFVGLYKINEHISFILGPGLETSEGEESFWLLRTGIDYGWELPKNFEIGVSIINDFKFDAYNSWTFGLGISKLLYK